LLIQTNGASIAGILALYIYVKNYCILIQKINADKINQTVTLEIGKDDLEKIIGSVNHMVNKQQQILLENLPSNDSDRKNLDDYKALAENLRKIWELR
jgi:hypothetical protein